MSTQVNYQAAIKASNEKQASQNIEALELAVYFQLCVETESEDAPDLETLSTAVVKIDTSEYRALLMMQQAAESLGKIVSAQNADVFIGSNNPDLSVPTVSEREIHVSPAGSVHVSCIDVEYDVMHTSRGTVTLAQIGKALDAIAEQKNEAALFIAEGAPAYLLQQSRGLDIKQAFVDAFETFVCEDYLGELEATLQEQHGIAGIDEVAINL